LGTAADPIGDLMDDDIQRRLDTFSRIWGRLDYKFIRVGVKPEHVQEYDLSEDPDEDTAKRLEENDSRTRRFKAKYGKLYAVELDALAGKEPEAFNQLVRNAVLEHWNGDIWNITEEDHKPERVRYLFFRNLY
jgi:hypothetical protein